MKIRHFIIPALVYLLALCPAFASLDVEVSLDSEITGVPIPISLQVPAGNWMVQDSTGKAVPSQMGGGTLWFLVNVPASSRAVKKSYLVKPGRNQGTAVSVEHSADKNLVICEHGSPVLVYNYRTMSSPDFPADRARSCYIHPVYDLQGQVLTDDFAPDHPHHRGIAWMFPTAIVGESRFDHWHMRGIRTKFRKVLEMESGPVFGRLKLANEWRLDNGEVIVDETTAITVFRSAPGGRILEVNTLLEARRPITLGSSATGYGGLNFRFAPRNETIIWTDKGVIKENVDRERYLWADLSAKFAGSDVFTGAALFDHSNNPHHPTGWTLRPYGILNPSFTGIEEVTITPGSPLNLQYRIWIHDGDAVSGNTAKAYQAYVQPPTVQVRQGVN